MTELNGWYHEWYANGWFPAVWFATADEEHLTEEERRPLALVPFDHEVARKRQPPEHEHEEALARLFRRKPQPVVEAPQPVAKTQQLQDEAAKVAAKKAAEQAETDAYWALHLYEQLLLKEAERLAQEAIAKARARQEEEEAFIVMAIAMLQ